MRYSWLDIVIWVIAIICLTPLVVHMAQVFASMLGE